MLNPSQIIPFLQNSDVLIRDLAVRYLSQAHDPSPATCDDIWRMIDTGRADGTSAYTALTSLPQTESSLRSALNALEKAPPEQKGILEESIANTSFGLLMRFQDLIESASGLSEALRQHVHDRGELAAIAPGELWDRLKKLAASESVISKEGCRIVEALSRNPEAAHWAIGVLNDKTNIGSAHLYSIQLLGQMHHRQSAELIADYLSITSDEDVLLETIAEALIRIGGTSIVQLLFKRYGRLGFAPRLYAVDVLSGAKLAQAEQALAKLLASEMNKAARTKLATALCETATNDPAALELLRKMVNNGDWDRSLGDLDADVLALFTMVGNHVPELSKWRMTSAEQSTRRKKPKSDRQWFDRSPQQRPLRKSVFADHSAAEPDLVWAVENEAKPAPAVTKPKPLRREVSKVGRNDPCTCGSGKKYKKCCGK